MLVLCVACWCWVLFCVATAVAVDDVDRGFEAAAGVAIGVVAIDGVGAVKDCIGEVFMMCGYWCWRCWSCWCRCCWYWGWLSIFFVFSWCWVVLGGFGDCVVGAGVAVGVLASVFGVGDGVGGFAGVAYGC